MKKIIITISILLLPSILLSQTIVDSLNVYGIWTKAASPYLINSDIAVASYDSLIIEPGVQVIFQNYYLFQVFGHFSAIGEIGDSIYFTVADTTGYYNNAHKGWGGIDFGDYINPSNHAVLNFCHIEFSKASGIWVWESQVIIEDSKILYCESGLDNWYGSLKMERFEIGYSAGSGLFLYETNLELIDINNFYIHHCGATGIYCGMHTALSIKNGLIEHNSHGIITTFESGPRFESIEIRDNGNFEGDGGGVYALGGCELTNCNISHNYAQNGGGIYAEPIGWEHITITNCIITDNVVANEGGGIYNMGNFLEATNLVLSNNMANNGGGIASHPAMWEMSIVNSVISDNTANENGGGIYINGYGIYGGNNGQSALNNIQVNANQAGINGGGIFANSCQELTLNGTITNNTAGQDGGGIYANECGFVIIDSAKINNNSATNAGGAYFKGDGLYSVDDVEISNNHASNNAGAVYIDSTIQKINLNRITNVFNTADLSGGGIYMNFTDTVEILNSIFWNNSPDEIVDTTGNLFINFSDIPGGFPGLGNINADPLFTDPANDDYNLSWLNFPLEDYTKSPCIGSGSAGMDMGTYTFDSAYYEQFLPVIHSILDVPNDQGKQVVINWSRSILDVIGGTIDQYTIWRKQNWAKEPWEFMGETPAQNFEEYAFIAPTISDSTANGIPYFTFLVTAVNADSNIYYNSYPDSGYSVDNYPPDSPLDFIGFYHQDTVKLSWQASPETDLSYYSLYRSDNPDSFPEFPYVTIENESYYDLDLVPDTFYYKLTATDFNGNESVSSDTLEVIIPKEVILDLKVYLEGAYVVTGMVPYLNLSGLLPYDQPYNTHPWYYEGTETIPSITNLNIVDWMLVELRDAITVQEAANSQGIGRSSVFVQNDGNLVAYDQFSLPRIEADIQNNLFIVLYHRNHVYVMSSSPVQQIDGIYSYNFTTGTDKVYGGDYVMKNLGNNNWGMVAGDASGDGQINNIDKNNFWYPEYLNNDYKLGDFDMNGIVDDADRDNYLKPNFGKGAQEY